ncbi:cytochrome c [Cytophagales bacterium LB-30]|uniref:Cytochrome c n=1 Tax=Shiella aurantiaca TaxID=3058365 RepID=A0ABT8F7P8_9BACT|nr:cytochrome c [Shiella aurantiaca]MDN4166241.1 cytochrome c [Shiella aurantiaca]
MKSFVKFAGIALGVLILAIAALLSYVKFALPKVDPTPEMSVKPNDYLLKRGEYLANHVTVCMDCHSERDWTKFSAPLKEVTLGKGGDRFDTSMGFPGTFYAKNITPAGIGHWTDGELYRAITTGVTPDGRALFPVMPYLSYGKMDPSDVQAIIAYVRSLSPIESQIPERSFEFPMNFIINTIPQNAKPSKMPSPDQVLAYGEYLTTIAACGDCHTPQDKGAPLPGMAFAGGFEFKMPFGTLRSANITPHASGIGEWSKEAFINKFKTYADSSYLTKTVDADAFNTVMPWVMYSGMTEQDLGAIYEYLQSLAPVENKVERLSKN